MKLQFVAIILSLSISIVDAQNTSYALCNNDDKQLLMTHVLWRHGDRSPSDTYPTDPHQESAWPQGWAQLTQIGMQETYNVGQLIKQRYITNFKLVPAMYKRNLVYMRSTDADRAIQSGLSVLAGLYPPANSQVWNDKFNWQPVPIHVKIPANDDILLKVTTTCKAKCDQYKLVKAQIAKRLEANFQTMNDLRMILLEHSGFENITLDELNTITSASFKERIHNMTQPSWIDQPYPDENSNQTLYEYMETVNTMYNLAGDENLIKAKFEGGYLLNDIIQRMVRAVEQFNSTGHIFDIADDGGDVPPDRKLMLYSTHDGTLTGLMINMKIPKFINLPYATTLFFDLYYDCKKMNYYVQLNWSLDQKTVKPISLLCSNASSESNEDSLEDTQFSNYSACTLSDFLSAFNDRLYTKEQWQNDCNA